MNQFREQHQTCHAFTANRWNSLVIRLGSIPFIKKDKTDEWV